MEPLDAKINQFSLEPAGKLITHVKPFSTKPTKALAGKAGKIFGLVEIESSHPAIPRLVDVIIEDLKEHYYYGKESAPLTEEAAVARFEQSLRKTNLSIASFIESEQITIDLDHIHVIAGLIHHQDLHLSFVGDMSALLFYHAAKDSYRIVNISESAQVTVSPDPLKIFSQIVSGKIRQRDILFLSTSNVFDYFSIDRVKTIITGQITVNSLVEFKQMLEQTQSRHAFGALTLEVEKVVVPAEKVQAVVQEFDYREAASRDSINQLVKTEQETANFLTPSLMPEVKKYANFFTSRFYIVRDSIRGRLSSLRFSSRPRRTRPLPPPLPTAPVATPERPIAPRRNSSPLVNLNFKSAAGKIPVARATQALEETNKIIEKAYRSTIGKATQYPFLRVLAAFSNRIFGRWLVKFNRLPGSSKVLFISTGILLILFAGSIAYIGVKNTNQQKIEAASQIIVEAERKKNEAEASLIYRDENQAREYLASARDMVSSLDVPSKVQREQITRLLQDIEIQIEKLRHRLIINEPTQISNIVNFNGAAAVTPTLNANGRVVYAFDQNQRIFYKINSSNKGATPLPAINEGVNLIVSTPSAGTNAYYFSDSAAFRLSMNTDAFDSIVFGKVANASIRDVSVFNNRLYVLDPSTNQIYRHQGSANGFGAGTNWLRAGQDVSKATSIAVDGSVYVLFSDGTITKFDNGQPSTFSLNTVDPALQSPTKLRIPDGSKYMYVLDPASKRLVVFDKNGTLIQQFESPQFTDLKDFAVSEREKEIYLLSGTAVFAIPASHL